MPASAPNPSYTVFPMPPFLTMTRARPARDRLRQPAVPRHLRVRPGRRGVRAGTSPHRTPRAGRPGARHAAAGGPVEAPSSVAGVLFADWFTFLERQVVQEALDVFRSVEHRPGSTQTLADIANAFGLTDPDLVELNRDLPGWSSPAGPSPSPTPRP